MTGQNLIDLLNQSFRRSHILGEKENGVIIALDLEGRFFTVLNNEVVSKVNSEAFLKRSNNKTFQNPGGDVLWPAPEGSCFGYEYGTGNWRVPPSITGATWEVIQQSDNHCIVRAEIDLINNLQVGIPCIFERHISISVKDSLLIQNVREIIRYIGTRELSKTEFSLAPWSLCQFNSTNGSRVVMPAPSEKGDIWDMYTNSEKQRYKENDHYIVNANTSKRFQIGLSKNIPWIEYIHKNENRTFKIKRFINFLPLDQKHIDIADIPPNLLPSNKGVSLSIYCDPSGFMEIEACGGCTETLKPNTELLVGITTEFRTN